MKGLISFLLILVSFYSCAPNNVTIDNSLGTYFKEAGAEGCFAIMNNGTGEFTVYNLPRYRDSAFLPASTFKIVNALIGLQTGVISSDSMVIKWDGVTRQFPEWNKDLTMYAAFRASADPYFQEVARRIGQDTMQHWLDTLAYGTKKIKTRVDTFWLDHSLKITPDEELGLVKRLYFNQLPFFKVNQEAVKNAMVAEKNSAYTLAYKTGWAPWDGVHKKQIGWVVGWIEENRHPYFFVLNLESKDPTFDMPTVQMRILKSILQQLRFMQGKQ
ncbi:MAG TPA: penicillin-binding transpeptidase domain-containing protein [Chitinophagaceae bacterium]|nr:penicillin-binding transpeptidase domain-containing protein [Chitinophagaceae bacterium]